ncbi:transcriptional regulator with XRE-family HTH domain [Crossiella equi]|uniref:Transcriptional regulator with XRE-family HTH domain n=1 Tax=Crossiella equi TaxID=130796 RepID=A0ABS5ASM3_9PSEU|nr:helix-turn-helix transcriptional regulator [Crossiella equi]MBP2479576.1 transcriptional regulator with XRE-family HTH domain [Crossiella equi]
MDLGRRIRWHRLRRGLSVRALAGLAGLSPGFVSMVETGERALDRWTHLADIAHALGIPATDLLPGPPVPAVDPGLRAVLPLLREAIVNDADPRPGGACPPVAAGEVAVIVGLVDAGAHRLAAALLPAALAGLHRQAGRDRLSRRLLIHLYCTACVPLLVGAGQPDLAGLALHRAGQVVGEVDDPVHAADLVFWRAWALRGCGGEPLMLAPTTAAADRLRLRTSRELLAYARLHKRLAYAHAHLGADAEATAHFQEALRAAGRCVDRAALGGPPRGMHAGALAVDQVKLCYEMGRYDEAVAAAVPLLGHVRLPLPWQRTLQVVLVAALVAQGRAPRAVRHLLHGVPPAAAKAVEALGTLPPGTVHEYALRLGIRL